jgi:DNA-binding YbaB/EbfC family protein
MKPNLGNLMKQAQKMQENLQQAQEEMGNMEIIGESGGGLVTIVMTGRHEVRRVSIDASLLADDKDMLEDLVAAAINDAVQKTEKAVQDKFANVAGGLLPGMGGDFKMPF